jgi:monoterpene epsilon-lactone hydrolase
VAIIDGVDEERGRLLAFPQAPEAIEMRHLRAFVAVAEDLNFGRAAARLYLSQPALSRQISALERLVGCELLRRSTHSVELTLAGEALLDRTRALLKDLDEAISVTQSVGDEITARLARIWKPLIEASSTTDANLEEMRARYEALHAQFAPPPEVQVRPVNAGGVPGLLVGEQPDRPPTLLYLHGGGYVLGSAFGYRHLAGALAVAAGTCVLIPEYRLAPEHPFPAALEDARRAYEWLLEQGVERVVVAGDSAGGGLAMSLLLALREDGRPLPAGGLLLCPAVDLSGSTAAGMLTATMIREMRQIAEGYLAGHSLDDPIVSPLDADLSGLPPLLVQAATGDFAREEANRLADRARAHGVDARLELYAVATHVFQFFWSFLPEAADALNEAGRFVRELSARAAPGAASQSSRS